MHAGGKIIILRIVIHICIQFVSRYAASFGELRYTNNCEYYVNVDENTYVYVF